MSFARVAVTFAALWILSAPASAAPVLYNFRSGNFVSAATGVLTTSDFVTGWIVLPDVPALNTPNPPLVSAVFPTAFSFSVGPHLTITNATPNSTASFNVGINIPSSGPGHWFLTLSSADGSMSLSDTFEGVSLNDAQQSFGRSLNIGSWSGPQSVPEPATALLFVLGGAACYAASKRTIRTPSRNS